MTKKQNREFRPATRALRAGHDPHSYFGFVNPPTVHASTVLFPDSAAMRGRSLKYNYGLHGNPTLSALETAIDDLEGSHGTILLASGLAAVSVPLLAFLSAGDHVLVIDSVYAPTRVFCNTMLKRMGVEVEYFDPSEGEAVRQRMKPQTRVLFLEAPGSNTFEMIDVKALAAIGHENGAVVMLDNTWATPLFFRPLDHGVDLSIHALTKYPGGHSDVLMGSVSANAEHFDRLRAAQMQLGLNVSSDDAALVYRGLKTMAVRLKHHEAAALDLANWLERREEVAQVLHPALPSFPGHELWKRQFKGSSGLFAFVLDGASVDEADCFLDALSLFGLGFSWGGFESLAVQADLRDRTVATAPSQGLVIRLQVGLEDVEDLREDLEAGFAALAARRAG